MGKCDSGDPSSYLRLSSWKIEGDNSSKDCCSWDGIECDEDTGYVIRLDLSSGCLYGLINFTSSLFNLDHLQRLSLANNNFNHSPIPTQLACLSKLTYLNLSKSQFSGQVPEETSQLSKSSTLDLSSKADSYSSNKILKLRSSTFRSLIQNFASIKHLSLSHLNITPNVPESLAHLSSLTTPELYYKKKKTTPELEDCSLRCEFPTRVFHLPNLQHHNVHDNQQLTGYLPEFYSSSALKFMKLSSTSFSGMLPPSLRNPHQAYKTGCFI